MRVFSLVVRQGDDQHQNLAIIWPPPTVELIVEHMLIVKLNRNVKYPWYKIALTFIEKSNFENEDYIDKMTNMPWVWTVAQRLEQQPR